MKPTDVPGLTAALKNPKGFDDHLRTIGRIIPHLGRWSLLMSWTGLVPNAVVGPWALGIFNAIAKSAGGDRRAASALRELLNPVAVGKSMLSARGEALELIRRVESHERSEFKTALAGAPAWIRDMEEFPAYAMTTGDVGIRNIIKRHGYSDIEARDMTATGEPYLPGLKGIVDFRRAKSSALMEFLLPFVRTPANLAELAALSVPYFGSIAAKIRTEHGAPVMPVGERAARQIMGTMMVLAGYVAGLGISDDSMRQFRKYLTNAAGPFSMLMSFGIAAGQSHQRGQSIMSPGMAFEIESSLPLPTMEPIGDIVSFAAGSPRLPGIIPGVIREPIQWNRQAATEARSALPPRLRRNRPR